MQKGATISKSDLCPSCSSVLLSALDKSILSKLVGKITKTSRKRRRREHYIDSIPQTKHKCGRTDYIGIYIFIRPYNG